MQVICINDEGWEAQRSILFGLIKWTTDVSGPEYGETCIVTGSFADEGEEFYVLEKYSKAPDDGFLSECFIPLSSIDETEMNREHKTKKEFV